MIGCQYLRPRQSTGRSSPLPIFTKYAGQGRAMSNVARVGRNAKLPSFEALSKLEKKKWYT